jgi:hypothetical protein
MLFFGPTLGIWHDIAAQRSAPGSLKQSAWGAFREKASPFLDFADV